MVVPFTGKRDPTNRKREGEGERGKEEGEREKRRGERSGFSYGHVITGGDTSFGIGETWFYK